MSHGLGKPTGQPEPVSQDAPGQGQDPQPQSGDSHSDSPEDSPADRAGDSLHRAWARPGPDRSYTEADKLRALAMVAETGNRGMAARRLGMPPTTVWQWADRAERDGTLDELRRAVRHRMAWDYIDLAQRALAVALDRLEHGDPHLARDGTVHFLPVRARDAAMIASIATDKHALVTGQLGQGRPSDQGLADLADRLVTAMRTARAHATARDPEPAQPSPDPDQPTASHDHSPDPDSQGFGLARPKPLTGQAKSQPGTQTGTGRGKSRGPKVGITPPPTPAPEQ